MNPVNWWNKLFSPAKIIVLNILIAPVPYMNAFVTLRIGWFSLSWVLAAIWALLATVQWICWKIKALWNNYIKKIINSEFLWFYCTVVWSDYKFYMQKLFFFHPHLHIKPKTSAYISRHLHIKSKTSAYIADICFRM